ncbi:hypothetical protein EYF80_027451 [Liparis tanakae]|uniref:Uncharacterized protein n=1 Tax=Liparis tanakae TaxID=230148 RepID=A0A4Z2HBR9_9TELE|nr:hypothetical protein EYF80_027451 [Liparis tanakae]
MNVRHEGDVDHGQPETVDTGQSLLVGECRNFPPQFIKRLVQAKHPLPLPHIGRLPLDHGDDPPAFGLAVVSVRPAAVVPLRAHHAAHIRGVHPVFQVAPGRVAQPRLAARAVRVIIHLLLRSRLCPYGEDINYNPSSDQQHPCSVSVQSSHIELQVRSDSRPCSPPRVHRNQAGYMGGKVTCLRCAFMTRHEYGADSSSEAAANDGMAQETMSAPLPGVSPDIFACFGSSSACWKFAMLFGKTEEAPLPSSPTFSVISCEWCSECSLSRNILCCSELARRQILILSGSEYRRVRTAVVPRTYTESAPHRGGVALLRLVLAPDPADANGSQDDARHTEAHLHHGQQEQAPQDLAAGAHPAPGISPTPAGGGQGARVGVRFPVLRPAGRKRDYPNK